MSIYNDIIETEKLLDRCFDLETGEFDEEREKELANIHNKLIATGAENLCKARTNISSELDGLKAEAKRIADAIKRAERKIENLENSIFWIYRHQSEEKLKAGTFTISTHNSTQVKVTDDFADERFIIRKEIVQPDKVAIKEALKSGEQITGAELIINYNLTIK